MAAFSRRPVVLAPLLMLSMTVATFIMPSLGVLAPFILDDLGLSRGQFGWLITAIAGVTALTAPATGRLADRLGGRRMIVLLAVAIAVASLGISLAPTVLVLVLFAMISGVPNASGNPATNKIIVEQLPDGRRGTVMGVKQSGVQLGFVLTGLTLPSLALQLGWRGSFFALAALAVVFACVSAWLLPQDRSRPDRGRTRERTRLPSDVWWLTGYSALMGAAGSTVTTFLPLYATERLGLRATLAGATVSLIGLLGIVSRITLARLAERLGRLARPLAVLAWGAAAAVASIIAAETAGPGLIWFAAALAGVSVVAWNALANLAAITVVAPTDAGRSSGLVNFGFMGGFATGPAAFGAIVDHGGGYRNAWVVVLVLFVSGAVLMHGWSRRAERTARSNVDAVPMSR